MKRNRRLYIIRSARFESSVRVLASFETTSKAPINWKYFPCILFLTNCYTALKTAL